MQQVPNWCKGRFDPLVLEQLSEQEMTLLYMVEIPEARALKLFPGVILPEKGSLEREVMWERILVKLGMKERMQ